jgi:hypothetical protein
MNEKSGKGRKMKIRAILFIVMLISIPVRANPFTFQNSMSSAEVEFVGSGLPAAQDSHVVGGGGPGSLDMSHVFDTYSGTSGTITGAATVTGEDQITSKLLYAHFSESVGWLSYPCAGADVKATASGHTQMWVNSDKPWQLQLYSRTERDENIEQYCGNYAMSLLVEVYRKSDLVNPIFTWDYDGWNDNKDVFYTSLMKTFGSGEYGVLLTHTLTGMPDMGSYSAEVCSDSYVYLIQVPVPGAIGLCAVGLGTVMSLRRKMH